MGILLQRSISQPSLSLPFYSQSHSIVIYDPACDTYPFLQHLRLLSSRSAPVHNPHSLNSPPSTWPPKKISSITPMRSSEPMTQHLQGANGGAKKGELAVSGGTTDKKGSYVGIHST